MKCYQMLIPQIVNASFHFFPDSNCECNRACQSWLSLQANRQTFGKALRNQRESVKDLPFSFTERYKKLSLVLNLWASNVNSVFNIQNENVLFDE